MANKTSPNPNKPQSIEEVLNALDFIIEQAKTENNPIGIFTYVYRRTTFEIKKGIETGIFENNARMESFDVTFANLFLEAYWNFQNGKEISDSWKISLEADKDLTIIQHIILGMNAHINLDLGIAADKIMPAGTMPDLKYDFMKVNDILESLINEMEARISKVSRLFLLLDWIGGKKDETFINFSIREARNFAWDFANKLSNLQEFEKKQKIQQTDQIVADLGKLIHSPPGLILNKGLKLISWFEIKSIPKILEKLKES